MKKTKKLSSDRAAGEAFHEQYADKPTEPYYLDGKFINAHIGGAWPVDIFFAGFRAGEKFAKSKKSKMRNDLMCPVHGIELEPRQTKYGTLYRCSRYAECTVMGWDGSTSTPADKKTRRARKEAHEDFDRLWKGKGNVERNRQYRALSKFLGLPLDRTHIGMFDLETCQKVKEFCLGIK